MRVVFFGTPAFAVPSLEALLEAGESVALVVTRPDRPVGRHATPVPSPVAAAAASRGLPVARPDRLRGNRELLDEIARIGPDVGIVVAYGRLLPRELLDIPRRGFVNVHGSLLPRWRGASPVSAAILAGDSETGVVTMRVEPELDSGPVYLRRRVAIGAAENAETLGRRLAVEGASLLVETLRGLDRGTLRPTPQAGDVTFTRPLKREDGEADWDLPAGELERRLRAYTPWPGLFSFSNGIRVKILEARLGPPLAAEPGELRIAGGQALVGAGRGTSLEILRAQREGRPPVTGLELARALPPGSRLGVRQSPAASE
ncbi:MAG: methionyl-tRNA formyltransferase [Thermoanaerobaculia bacterium]